MNFATETTEDLLHLLVSHPSVTPDRTSCHAEIAERLKQLGFQTEMLTFGKVNNLWATYGKAPYFIFCGHTDVVPPGDESLWTHPPFSPTTDNGILYGRGVVDMKASIAAMLIAMRDYLSERNQGNQGNQDATKPDHLHHPGIAFLITADEEGEAIDGVSRALQELNKRGNGININQCLVGEPTSEACFGDAIKNGRRGSISLSLTLQGNQGHAAYIKKEDNLLHRTVDFINLLLAEDWDKNITKEKQTPPPGTSFNVVNLQGVSAADNVTAQSVQVFCNWRYAPPLVDELDKLKNRVFDMADKAGFSESQYKAQWTEGAKPYFCPAGALATCLQQAIKERVATTAKLTTSGGTSDGRFFPDYGVEVVEFGPRNATIHCVDECLPVDEINQLTQVYLRFLQLLFAV